MMYGAFDSPRDAYAALSSVKWPLVIKADGLCAGKGVFWRLMRKRRSNSLSA
jgi:phosphoribosylamine-glycine ligase